MSKNFKKKIKSITKELNKVIYNIVKTSHIRHNDKIKACLYEASFNIILRKEWMKDQRYFGLQENFRGCWDTINDSVLNYIFSQMAFRRTTLIVAAI